MRRCGTVRLRMTLWNVAVLALILGSLGGVVQYKVQADLFATVDRTLAEQAIPLLLQVANARPVHAVVRLHSIIPDSIRNPPNHSIR